MVEGIGLKFGTGVAFSPMAMQAKPLAETS